MVAMMSWGIKVQEQGWRKGPWTPEEDKLLSEYVTLHGEGRWSSVARCAGLNRSGKSCRLRWVNYLRPGLKRGQITPQEEGIIIELHGLWGNKWSTIARYLPGRTDNEIKNFWRTHFKKKDKPSNQKQLFQKRRSFQALKEKLQAKEDHDSKTTPLFVASTQMEIPTKAEAKTTSICTDHQQEIKLGNVSAALITNTNPTSDTDHANPVVYQDEPTALFPWSDAVADQEYYYGLWGGLWNLDDINYGCARTDKLATQNNNNNSNNNNNISNINNNQATINAGPVNNYHGSGDINYPNNVDYIMPNNVQNQARSFSSHNGEYIF